MQTSRTPPTDGADSVGATPSVIVIAYFYGVTSAGCRESDSATLKRRKQIPGESAETIMPSRVQLRGNCGEDGARRFANDTSESHEKCGARLFSAEKSANCKFREGLT